MTQVSTPPTVCPKCEGTEFYDNRGDKHSPKAPDFKCKECRNPFWMKRGSRQDQGESRGARPDRSTSTPTASPPRPPLTWGALHRTYDRCCAIARHVWPDATAHEQIAAAATIFIEASKRGLTAEKVAAPASHNGNGRAAPKQAPRDLAREEARQYAEREDRGIPARVGGAHDFSDFPEALDEEQDDLPF